MSRGMTAMDKDSNKSVAEEDDMLRPPAKAPILSSSPPAAVSAQPPPPSYQGDHHHHHGSCARWSSLLQEGALVSPSLYCFLCHLFVWLLLLAAMAERTEGVVVDYCDEHNYPTNSSYLQFTKEISNREYALANKFKSLHCCAKGYRSIEWYKDGLAYPWPSGVSNLILYPESANQTVYAQTVSTIDSGNYTCLVRNDSHVIRHSVLLFVFEPEVDEVGYTGSPLPTYEPRDRYASVGGEARFFCEAFVGRVDLPDAKSEVRWWRSIPSEEGYMAEDGVGGLAVEVNQEEQQADEEMVEQILAGLDSSRDAQQEGSRHHHHHHHRKHHVKTKPRYHQEVVPRENNQILGAYLVIREVQEEDFGEYRCSVRNAVGEHTLLMSSWLRIDEDDGSGGLKEVESKSSQGGGVEWEMEEDSRMEKNRLYSEGDRTVIVACFALTLCTLLVLMVLFLLNKKLDVLLFWKERCRKKVAGDEGKEYDVCIFYENKGKSMDVGIRPENPKSVNLAHIIPSFEMHNGYHCFNRPNQPTSALP